MINSVVASNLDVEDILYCGRPTGHCENILGLGKVGPVFVNYGLMGS